MADFPTAMPTFIFLHGPKGVGKSTLARALYDSAVYDLGQRPIIYHMGSPVYRAADVILDYRFSRDHLHSAFKEEKLPYGGGERGKTGRTLLVALGRLLREEISPQYFGHMAEEYVREMAPYNNKFIFDGVRFEDEIRPILEAFPNHSKLFIQIHRAGHTWDEDLGAYFAPTGVFCTDLHVDRAGGPEDCLCLLSHALERTAEMGENIS